MAGASGVRQVFRRYFGDQMRAVTLHLTVDREWHFYPQIPQITQIINDSSVKSVESVDKPE
jgi:hypothetical protein